MPFAARKTKKTNGFTLSEVLVVVALLAVLLAFAVPAVLGYVRRLKLRALDTDAQTIFMAAQDRLTAMAASGELAALKADGQSFEHEVTADDGSGAVTGRVLLHYLDSDLPDENALDLEAILPFGSIESELRTGRFVIEYSRETGAVYAVWYTDEEGFAYNPTTGRPPEDFGARLELDPLVGFFGGSIVDRPEVGQLPLPSLRLTNSELLCLDITVPNDAAGTLSGTQISVTLAGNDADGSPAEYRLPLNGSDSAHGLDPDQTARVVLDMLPGGHPNVDAATLTWTATAAGVESGSPVMVVRGAQFKDWTGNPIVPGSDITLTVELSAPGYLPQRIYVRTNSLFAGLTEARAGDGTGLDAGTPIAQIAFGRHLQNLDPTISGVPTGTIDSSFSTFTVLPGAVTAAAQVRAIDFSRPLPEPETGKDTHWALVYPDPSEPTLGLPFTPIYNEALVSFDGNEEPIRNLRVTAAGHNRSAGLFDTVGYYISNEHPAVQLKNVVLVDASVRTPSATSAGSLVGNVYSEARFTNCQVYLDSTSGLKMDAAGKPVPWVECNGFAAGGMVGILMANAHFTDSFAATVTRSGTAGGMVGMSMHMDLFLSEPTSFKNCYASGYVFANSFGGGLIAAAETADVRNCYATGTIDISGGGTDTTVGGVCNFRSDPSGAVINCYSAVHLELPAAGAAAVGDIYGISPINKSGTGITIRNAYYVAEVDVDYAPGYGESVSSQTLAASHAATTEGDFGLLNRDDDGSNIWYALSDDGKDPIQNPTYAAFPYHLPGNEELQTPYPYPMLASLDDPSLPMVHYGDWMEEDFTSGRLVYFEKYDRPFTDAAGNEVDYGLYGLNYADDNDNGSIEDGEKHVFANSLQYPGPNAADPLYATEDGFLVLSATELKTPRQRSYLVNGHDKDGKLLSANKEALFLEMNPYQLIPELTDPKDSHSATRTMPVTDPETGETTYYFVYRLGDIGWKDLLKSAKASGAAYYQTVTLLNGTSTRGDDRLCLINPLFACEAINYGDTGLHYEDPKIQNDNTVLKQVHTKLKLADPTGGVYAEDSPIANGILIRTARQLAELGDYTTTVQYAGAEEKIPLAVRADASRGAINADKGTATTYRHWYQLLDIDYGVYTRDRETSGGNYEGGELQIVNGTFETGKSDAKPQAPIVLHTGESYDGLNYIIRGAHTGVLVLGSSDDIYGGLFGLLRNQTTVQNVRLVNTRACAAKVTADGAGIGSGSYRLRTGALAGLTKLDSGAIITNCRVYVEPDAAGTYNSYDSAYRYYCVDAHDTAANVISHAGGLVGTLSLGSTVENSLAAVRVLAKTTGAAARDTADIAGGLIGSGRGTAVNCYAGGHTAAGVYDLAEPNVSAVIAGGFLGLNGNINISNTDFTAGGVCYSTCSVSGTQVGQFCGMNRAGKGTSPAATLYAVGAVQGSTVNSEDYLTAPGAAAGSKPDRTVNYDTTLNGRPYPYANPVGVHYGDWVEQKAVAAYYEEYSDGSGTSFGFYGYGPDGTLFNKLTKGTPGADGGEVREHAVADGYALLVPKDAGAPANVSYAPAGTAGAGTSLTGLVKLDAAVNIGGEIYDAWALPDTVPVGADTYYYTLRADGADIAWFNPHFACEVHNVPAAGTPANTPLAKPGAGGESSGINVEAGEVAIRTARQLAKLGEYTNVSTAAQGRTYRQLLDIDFPAYKGRDGSTVLPGCPLRDADNGGAIFTDTAKYTTAGLFTPIHLNKGKYYGGEHIIRDMFIRSTIADGSARAAGVFGVVEGENAVLDGIRLLDVKIFFNDEASNAVGALVGMFREGTINNCGVYCTTGNSSEETIDGNKYDRPYYRDYGIASNNVNAVIGGLVGKLESGSAEDSFAAVKVYAHLAGGFAGSIGSTGKTVTVTDCYSGGNTLMGQYIADSEHGGTDTMNVSSSGHAGGFAGQLNGEVTFKGVCYTTCSVSGPANSSGLFIGSGTEKLKKDTDALLYSSGVAFAEKALTTPQAESYLAAPAIPEVTGRTGFTAAAYDVTLRSAAFPYPSDLDVHHGDWGCRPILVYYEEYTRDVAEMARNNGRVMQIDGKWYGFFGSWLDLTGNARSVDTLALEGTASDAGYAFLSAQELTSYVWGSQTFDGTANSVKSAGDTAATTETDENKKTTRLKLPGAAGDLPRDQLLYTLPFDALNTAPLNDYYRTITINGLTAVFNPHFACEAVNRANGAPVTYTGGSYTPFALDTIQNKTVNGTAVTAGVVIRTPHDLASVARYTSGLPEDTANSLPASGNKTATREKAQAYQYHQLLNVDYKAYTGKINDGEGSKATYQCGKTADAAKLHVPLVLGTGGLYDGHGYTISNLFVGKLRAKDDRYTDLGLFSTTNGSTLQNIVLDTVTVTDGGENTGSVTAMGGLVGTATDTDITNITVKTLTVANTKVTGLTKLGGLAGGFSGSKKLTLAAVDGVTVTAAGNSGNFGGLIGEISKGQVCPADSAHTPVQVKNVSLTVENAPKATSLGGLVGWIEDKSTFKNLEFVDAKITADNGQFENAGGLIGRAKGSADISDCGIYVSAANRHSYSDYGVEVTLQDGLTTSNVGGVAGRLNSGSTPVRVFAAVSVQASQATDPTQDLTLNVGGFAGLMDSTVIQDCYVGGHTNGGSYNKDNPNVTAIGSRGTLCAGGFVGKIDDNQSADYDKKLFKGVNYTTASVGGSAGKTTAGLFAATFKSSDHKDADATVYALGSAFAGGAAVKPVDEPYLDMPTAADTTIPSVPYDDFLFDGDEPKRYPYPVRAGQTLHHGDWSDDGTPTKLPESIGLMAVYKDGTKIAWFSAGNTSAAGDAPFRMWDKDGNEITPISADTTVPNQSDLLNVAMILKNYNFRDSSTNDIRGADNKDNIGTFSVTAASSDTSAPNSILQRQSDGWDDTWGPFSMPPALNAAAGYCLDQDTPAWHWLYKKGVSRNVPYNARFTIAFEKKEDIVTDFTLSIELSIKFNGEDLKQRPATTSSAPGEPGPSMSSLPNGPEIVDESAPPSDPATPENPQATPEEAETPPEVSQATPEESETSPQGDSATPEESTSPPEQTPEQDPEQPPEQPPAAPEETDGEPESSPEPTPEPTPGGLLPPA